MGLPIVEDAPQMPETQPHDEEKVVIAKNLAAVKRKVGIHSGKGGVGKTFLSVNIAMALAAAGKSVGLLDADVDCPNVAKFLNLRDVPLNGTADGRIFPLEYKGMKLVSTHFMTDNPSLPMIVRGPIKHKVVAEMLEKVEWGELDVLVYDLPPGTSDVPMSSMMIGSMDGIVIVTTPQQEAIMDARKSAIMAKDMDVPVLGVVENMSGDVFGTGSGEELARELDVPFLGTIPLTKEIRQLNEKGKAVLCTKTYQDTAQKILKGVTGETLAMKQSFWRNLVNR
ncbi:MAG: P-loop NTPase [Candidatus Woesearchaeota archaeon]|nr:P-loop NTPase [Candidatus Woesearchaeota archaeon]